MPDGLGATVPGGPDRGGGRAPPGGFGTTAIAPLVLFCVPVSSPYDPQPILVPAACALLRPGLRAPLEER